MIKRVQRPETKPGQPVARPRRGRITGAINQPTPPLDADKARGAEEAQTRVLMQNWAAWKQAGSDLGGGSERGSGVISSAYNLEARGRRSAVAIPLINGDAVIVDQAVRILPPELRRVIHAHWLQEIEDGRGRLKRWEHANVEQRARGCRCTVATYYRRLGHAHDRIRALLRARKDQAARAALAYRESRANLVKSPM